MGAIPITDDNVVNCNQQRIWLQRLATEEEAGKERTVHGLEALTTNVRGSYVAPPGPVDVVVGKGNLLKRFAGNARMKKLIEESRHGYDTSRRGGKGAIIDDIYGQLIGNGTRFLSPVGGKVLEDISANEWKEVDEKVAKERIGHSFRNLRSATKYGGVLQSQKYS